MRNNGLQPTEKKTNGRIPLLDELRGFAVFCMIFYHSFYLAFEVFSFEAGKVLFNFFMPAQPFFAALFIAVSGISSRLSSSNFKRGAKLAAIALGISLLTCLILPALGFSGFEIRFGILHLLSVCMLFFALVKPLLDKINPCVGMPLFFLLYVLTRGVTAGFVGFDENLSLALPSALYDCGFLFPFGFLSEGFYSADYFPIFPNIFLFLSASFLGVPLSKRNLPAAFYKQHIPPLAFLGRYALYAYLLHYPAALIILLPIALLR